MAKVIGGYMDASGNIVEERDDGLLQNKSTNKLSLSDSQQNMLNSFKGNTYTDKSGNTLSGDDVYNSLYEKLMSGDTKGALSWVKDNGIKQSKAPTNAEDATKNNIEKTKEVVSEAIDDAPEIVKPEKKSSEGNDEEYKPEENKNTPDVYDPNKELAAEYDQLLGEIEAEESEVDGDVLQDALDELLGDYDDSTSETNSQDDGMSSRVNRSTTSSVVVNSDPFDWGSSRDVPDYYEERKKREPATEYERAPEIKLEKATGPLTNKTERDTTRIGRHY